MKIPSGKEQLRSPPGGGRKKRRSTMDKFFKISERGSNVRTEIVGGITTFFAMAYIIFVNPNTLCVNLNAGTGNPDFFPAMPGELWTPVLVATCASAAIGCILTALLGSTPSSPTRCALAWATPGRRPWPSFCSAARCS